MQQGLVDARSSAAQIHVRCQEQIYSGGSLVHIKGLATAGNAEAGAPMAFAGAVNDGIYGKWVIGCALFAFVGTARVYAGTRIQPPFGTSQLACAVCDLRAIDLPQPLCASLQNAATAAHRALSRPLPPARIPIPQLAPAPRLRRSHY